MKYKIVQCVEGKFSVINLDDSNLHTVLQARGFDFAGLEENRRLRSELIGEPKFTGLLGPMWDGDGIRYEDEETYRILSA